MSILRKGNYRAGKRIARQLDDYLWNGTRVDGTTLSFNSFGFPDIFPDFPAMNATIYIYSAAVIFKQKCTF